MKAIFTFDIAFNVFGTQINVLFINQDDVKDLSVSGCQIMNSICIVILWTVVSEVFIAWVQTQEKQKN